MKKILCIALICFSFACKKKNSTPELANTSWALVSATVNPAYPIDGKTITNFKDVAGGCLNYNYTLSFLSNGHYAFSSTGPLCDMISFQNATYTQNGGDLTLNDGFGHTSSYQLSGSKITNQYTFEKDNITYTVTYIYSVK